MKSHQRHKCRCCQELFKPDFRNAHQQKYCSKPECRKASKRASNQKWLAKPENENYYRGPQAVARVQEAQKLHPEYRARQKAKRQAALQVNILPTPSPCPCPPHIDVRNVVQGAVVLALVIYEVSL